MQLVYARLEGDQTGVELCVKGEGQGSLLLVFRLTPDQALDLSSQLLTYGLALKRKADRDPRGLP